MPYLVIALLILLVVSVRQVNQYERGVKFQFGRYLGTREPGWRLVFPIIQSMKVVDVRVKASDVPDQDAITKDNVSVKINAVIYYKISDASKAIIEVEDFRYAVSQLAQTTMRNVTGEVTLDELLGSRDQISNRIKQVVDESSEPWGVEVLNVELKDILLPDGMKRTIAKQAEAERERRAVIINSEGEIASAANLAKAAEILAGQPGALHLRTLNSINDISSDESNTVVFVTPIEVLRAVEGFTKKS